MSQPEPNILQLAKQGNPKAIATIINKQLEPKGIIAQVDLKDECLRILIESVELPEKVTIVEYFRRSFITLDAGSIKSIKIYGKQTGKVFLSWDDSFNLVESASSEPLQVFKNIDTNKQQENSRNLQIKFDEIKNEFSNHLLKIVLISMGFSVSAVEVSSNKSEGKEFTDLSTNASSIANLVIPSNFVVNKLEGLVFAAGVAIITSIGQEIIGSFKSANDFYKEGKNFMESKLYSEALISFTKVIAKDKKYADAFYQRGNIYFLIGDYTKAYEEFNQVISIVPSHIKAYKNRALARYALEDYDGAISDNTFVINQKSNDYASYFNRAITYFTTKSYTKSLDDLTRAIQLNPQDYLIYLMRANIYLYIKNNPDKAIQDFNSAIQIQPSYEADLGLAIAHYWNKKHNDAIRQYTKVISSNIKDIYKIAYKGRCLSHIALNKKWEARVDAFRVGWKIKQLNFNIAELIILLAIPAIFIVMLFKNSYQNPPKPSVSLQPVKLETFIR